jgi:hypothetical protein
MDAAVLALILTLAVASIVMVIAMVQFSVAIMFAPERPLAFKLWGLAYLAAWAAIAAVMVQGAVMAKATLPQGLAVGTLVAGGWGTFHAFWVWLALSIQRTKGRETGQSLAPVKESICRRAGFLATGGLIAVALALIELGYASKLLEAMIAPGHRAIAATVAVTAIGFFLLLFGAVRLVLRRGEAMSREEIDEELRRGKFARARKAGSFSASRSAYRHLGPAEGAKAEQELSIGEMTRAWRSGEWRRDPNLLNIFIMTAGGLMMLYGGFGSAVVAGPLFVKVICGVALAFTTYKLVDAVRRA